MKSIQFKRTNKAGVKPTPAQLKQGEICINLKDHVIYTKDKDNQIIQISGSPEEIARLEQLISSNKTELAQAILSQGTTINQKIDEIKTATDATILANKTAIESALQESRNEIDEVITNNREHAEQQLVTAKKELASQINDNKDDADAKIILLTGTVESNQQSIISKIDKADQNLQTQIDILKEKVDNPLDLIMDFGTF
ncbi:TPA: hypothetical protein SMP26_001872 [Proteus mirabilis]|nr:hypothetical protein [Proteus mirabilis]